MEDNTLKLKEKLKLVSNRQTIIDVIDLYLLVAMESSEGFSKEKAEFELIKLLGLSEFKKLLKE
jgi:hypothetical protein